tara:strand:+ start:668 stop:1012 length:345 start_codon:yes stop_codon:yes gene_type:complete
LATIKIAENATVWSVTLFGETVTRNDSISTTAMQALFRVGDRNLMVSFSESDREDLLLVEDKHLPFLSIELGSPVSSSQELVDLLLPKAIVPKKITLPKSKKQTKVASKSQLVE